MLFLSFFCGFLSHIEISCFLSTHFPPQSLANSKCSSPQYNKHLFVNISQNNPSYSDPMLECVDIRQIYDKFPEKKGGLKELFAKGPQNAFYLIKFWVSRQTLTYFLFMQEFSFISIPFYIHLT